MDGSCISLPAPGRFGDHPGDPKEDLLVGAGIDFAGAREFFLRTLPPFDWIVEDMLAVGQDAQRGFKGDLVAGSKGRKSFFAIQLGLLVAAGRDVFGYRVPKARKVAYLNLELVTRGFQERVLRMCRSLGIDPHEVWRNFTPLTLPVPGRIREEAVLDAFVDKLRRESCELVIIDPQYKLYEPGEDESTGVGLSGVLRFRDRIITDARAAVLMVMHDSKGGNTGDRRITDRGAGSGFAGRDYDARFVLTPHADGDDSHVVLSSSSRYRARHPDRTLTFDNGAMVFVCADEIDPCQQTSASEGEARVRKAREQRLDADAALYARVIDNIIGDRHGVLIDRSSFVKDLARRANCGVNCARDQIDAAVADGRIAQVQESRLLPNGEFGPILHAKNLYGRQEDVDRYLDDVRRRGGNVREAC